MKSQKSLGQEKKNNNTRKRQRSKRKPSHNSTIRKEYAIFIDHDLRSAVCNVSLILALAYMDEYKLVFYRWRYRREAKGISYSRCSIPFFFYLYRTRSLCRLQHAHVRTLPRRRAVNLHFTSSCVWTPVSAVRTYASIRLLCLYDCFGFPRTHIFHWNKIIK